MKRTTIAFFVLALVPLAAAQERVALREGLIIHPTEPVAYVMSPDHAVAAVDLRSGELLWKSSDAAKPLALSGNMLVSQIEPKTVADANRLQLASLNVQQRGRAVARNAMDLPDGVRATTAETVRGKFTATAQPAAGASVVVTWRYVPRRGPARNTTNRQAPAPVNGAIRMNVTTGAMSRTSAPMVPGASSTWTMRDNTAAAASSKTEVRRFQSADGRHVLASERVADDREWQNYRWTVSDAATGRTLGETRSHVAFAPFVIRGSVLVFETTPYALANRNPEPAKLRGVDLTSGRETWSVPVREVVYRGPMPP